MKITFKYVTYFVLILFQIIIGYPTSLDKFNTLDNKRIIIIGDLNLELNSNLENDYQKIILTYFKLIDKSNQKTKVILDLPTPLEEYIINGIKFSLEKNNSFINNFLLFFSYKNIKFLNCNSEFLKFKLLNCLKVIKYIENNLKTYFPNYTYKKRIIEYYKYCNFSLRDYNDLLMKYKKNMNEILITNPELEKLINQALFSIEIQITRLKKLNKNFNLNSSILSLVLDKTKFFNEETEFEFNELIDYIANNENLIQDVVFAKNIITSITKFQNIILICDYNHAIRLSNFLSNKFIKIESPYCANKVFNLSLALNNFLKPLDKKILNELLINDIK